VPPEAPQPTDTVQKDIFRRRANQVPQASVMHTRDASSELMGMHANVLFLLAVQHDICSAGTVPAPAHDRCRFPPRGLFEVEHNPPPERPRGV
jgi:hypothetical protein